MLLPTRRALGGLVSDNIYTIFPDDLADESHLSLTEAALLHESKRQSYVKKEKRDYSAAYAMIGQKPAERHEEPKEAEKAAPLAASILPAEHSKAAFISRGLSKKAANTLDTSGIKQFLAGEDPDGGHLFELSFAENLLGGLRCSLSSSAGRVKAIFYASSHEAARRLEENLPLLREKLLSRGLHVDELAVKVE